MCSPSRSRHDDRRCRRLPGGSRRDEALCHRRSARRKAGAALRCRDGGGAGSRCPARAAPSCSRGSSPYRSRAACRRSPAPLLSIPGSAHRGGTGTTRSPPVSAAIRRARRPQSDADGRSTSIGQETKESMIGRSASISCRQSAHADARLANRRGGIHLTFLSGSPLWQPITRRVEPFVRVTEITVRLMWSSPSSGG